MIMAKQSLGNLVFYRNPKHHELPVSKKTVAVLPTYSGSAIFQWDPTLEGAPVNLEWDWMVTSNYDAIMAMYLSLETYVWVSQYKDKSFEVVIVDLKGELAEDALDNLPYRTNVVCTLNIRREL